MSYLGLETTCEVVSLNFHALISTAEIPRIDLKEHGTRTRTRDMCEEAPNSQKLIKPCDHMKHAREWHIHILYTHLGLRTLCEVVSLNFHALLSTTEIPRIDLKEHGTRTWTRDPWEAAPNSPKLIKPCDRPHETCRKVTYTYIYCTHTWDSKPSVK
jgi:hypothetical protein